MTSNQSFIYLLIYATNLLAISSNENEIIDSSPESTPLKNSPSSYLDENINEIFDIFRKEIEMKYYFNLEKLKLYEVGIYNAIRLELLKNDQFLESFFKSGKKVKYLKDDLEKNYLKSKIYAVEKILKENIENKKIPYLSYFKSEAANIKNKDYFNRIGIFSDYNESCVDQEKIKGMYSRKNLIQENLNKEFRVWNKETKEFEKGLKKYNREKKMMPTTERIKKIFEEFKMKPFNNLDLNEKIEVSIEYNYFKTFESLFQNYLEVLYDSEYKDTKEEEKEEIQKLKAVQADIEFDKIISKKDPIRSLKKDIRKLKKDIKNLKEGKKIYNEEKYKKKMAIQEKRQAEILFDELLEKIEIENEDQYKNRSAKSILFENLLIEILFYIDHFLNQKNLCEFRNYEELEKKYEKLIEHMDKNAESLKEDINSEYYQRKKYKNWENSLKEFIEELYIKPNEEFENSKNSTQNSTENSNERACSEENSRIRNDEEIEQINSQEIFISSVEKKVSVLENNSKCILETVLKLLGRTLDNNIYAHNHFIENIFYRNFLKNNLFRNIKVGSVLDKFKKHFTNYFVSLNLVGESHVRKEFKDLGEDFDVEKHEKLIGEYSPILFLIEKIKRWEIFEAGDN